MREAEMKLPARETIEAYLSADGYICLRQSSELSGEAIVMLPPQDIPRVVEWLQCLARKRPAPPTPE